MKKLLYLLPLMCFGYSAMAQVPSGGNPGSTNPSQRSGSFPGAGAPAQNTPTGNGRLSGTVIDQETQQPVPYATVTLTLPESDKPVDGTVADEKGKFQLKNIPAGSYQVSISFIGYKAVEKSSVTFTEKDNTVDLGNISLASDTKELDEVVVQGQRDLIEEKVDRTVYNAENDQTTKGGDATDVLRRVPMLSVDLDGNVSLRGSQNIKVLIDNKPSTITANSIGDALKQIPADQIKSVEVITSPSARYDAEGSGGIINIITKKNKLQGGSLGIDASAGTRGSNLGLNGSYRRGKLGLSLGGFGRTGYNINGSFENRQVTYNEDGSQTVTLQQADTRSRMMFGRYNFGWDYEISKFHWLSGSVQYGLRNFNNFQDPLITQTFLDNTLQESNLRTVDMGNYSGTVDVSLNYIRTFAKPQREFSLMTLYSRNNQNNDFTNNILEQSNEEIISRLKNENNSYNQEITIQADYTTPIGDNQILAFGGKDILRKVSSRYQYFTATGADGPYIPLSNDLLSNVFNYEQNVTSGYLSYTLNLDKYSIMPGARYEYTTIQANFQEEQEVEIPSYGVLVPSLNISRKLSNGDMLKAAYNRRIQRPSLEFLNPNLQASNPLNITQGNPDLEPEYTNNYEVSYNTFIKNTSLNFSAFMRNSRGSIQPVRSVIGQDTILTTFQNIGQTDHYGMSLFSNINISNKFSLNGGVDTYYAVLENNVADPLYNAQNEGWVVSGRIFGNYNFTPAWGLQFFSFFRGRDVQLQGYRNGFRMYSLSIKRDFKDKKGSIGFGAENFFTPEMRMRNEINSPVISQSSVNTMRNMSFKINFSYRIGKLNVNPQARRRKSIQNDDLKEGGDNNGQMNSQQR